MSTSVCKKDAQEPALSTQTEHYLCLMLQCIIFPIGGATTRGYDTRGQQECVLHTSVSP